MQVPQTPQWRRIGTPVALALVSLIAALILWIAVTDAENPQEVDDFRVPLEVQAVNVPEGLAVASIPQVRLRVSGDSNVLSSLTTSDFRITVDLMGVTDFSLPQDVNVTVLTDNVGVVAVSPQQVMVTVEPFATKQVAIRPNPVGVPPQGYTLPVPETSPTLARVSGARSLVEKVEVVTADVNLTGLRTSITQQTLLVARDNKQLELPRVTVEPTRAEVRVTVQQQEISVPLAIEPTLQGNVASGYNITEIRLEPETTTVTGTLETTSALTAIGTEPIDVSGLRTDVVRTVRLRLPAGIRAARETVTVRVSIAPAQGEMIINVAPQYTNLGEEFSASFQTATIGVRVRGDMPVLRSLTPGQIRATVNASELVEGVHVRELQISGLPQGVQVISLDPAQAVLVVTRR